MRRIIRFATIFVSMHLLIGAGKAADLVHMTEELPPYNYSKEGELKGYSVEILLKMFDEMNLPQKEREIVVLPWARAYLMAQKKSERNILFSTARRPDREKLFNWVGPVVEFRNVIFARKGHGKVKNIEKILKKSYVGIRDDNATTAMEKLGIKNIIKVARAPQMFNMLLKGRVDYFGYVELGAIHLMRTHGFNPSDFEVIYTMSSIDGYFALNLSLEDKIVKKYQDALDRVKANKGFMAEIKSKYYE